VPTSQTFQAIPIKNSKYPTNIQKKKKKKKPTDAVPT
jgi:hypothetical protein